MKTRIYPDRKGSRAARTARIDCCILAALCLVGAVAAFLSDDFADLFPGLLGGAVALLLLAALFRVLGCIAYDLETIAATKELDYTEQDGDNAD